MPRPCNGIKAAAIGNSIFGMMVVGGGAQSQTFGLQRLMKYPLW